MSDWERLRPEFDLAEALRQEMMRRPGLEHFTVKGLLAELERQFGSAAAAARETLKETKKPARAVGFAVPSEHLVREMINVSAEEWADPAGRPESEALEQATRELREDLLATIADFALTALETGQSGEVALSRDGRLDDSFVRELMRNLPIDPYVAPHVLKMLHEELLEPARSHGLRASWGELIERDGDLSLRLIQQEHASRRPLAALAT